MLIAQKLLRTAFCFQKLCILLRLRRVLFSAFALVFVAGISIQNFFNCVCRRITSIFAEFAIDHHVGGVLRALPASVSDNVLGAQGVTVVALITNLVRMLKTAVLAVFLQQQSVWFLILKGWKLY